MSNVMEKSESQIQHTVQFHRSTYTLPLLLLLLFGKIKINVWETNGLSAVPEHLLQAGHSFGCQTNS